MTIKFLSIAIVLMLNGFSFAQEKIEKKKEDEKIYTQKDFDEKLQQELAKKLKSEIDRFKKSSVAELAKDLVDREQKINKKLSEVERQKEMLKLSEKNLQTQISQFQSQKKKV